MSTVRVTDADRIVIGLEPDEAEMLADLAEQLAALVESGPDDPALTRLFPAAYRDDVAAAAEFDRLERADLTASKLDAARAVQAAASTADPGDGEPVEIELSAAEVWPWLTHLTDVRVVLAERLGIDDDESELEADEDTFALVPLYDWLGWLQGALVQALEALETAR